MIEAGVVITLKGPVHWHLPPGRTMGSIPDTRELWDVLWEHRKAFLLGFVHSHPGGGIPGPSNIDITTFAAIEAGLGRRLTWGITSSQALVAVTWKGPGPHDYGTRLVPAEPAWADELRAISSKEK